MKRSRVGFRAAAMVVLASDTRRRPRANRHTQDGARVSPTVPGCGGR
jgi:hypothetical protein